MNAFLQLTLVLLSGSFVGQAHGVPAQKGVASTNTKTADTYFIACDDENKTSRTTGPVSVHEKWRAYVEVSVQPGCLFTTRLWMATPGSGYRLLYLIPPDRVNTSNGMKILGWAPHSRMVLLQTERWANGSDAGPDESIVGMDAKTGEVYQPDLSAVLQHRKPRCAFHINGGGFDANPNVVLLVRVKLFSFYEVDETEADVPEGDRCTAGEETWSFNYANGEIKRVENSTVLHLADAKLPHL